MDGVGAGERVPRADVSGTTRAIQGMDVRRTRGGHRRARERHVTRLAAVTIAASLVAGGGADALGGAELPAPASPAPAADGPFVAAAEPAPTELAAPRAGVLRERVDHLDTRALLDRFVEPGQAGTDGGDRAELQGRPVELPLFDGDVASFTPVEVVATDIPVEDTSSGGSGRPTIAWHGRGVGAYADATAVFTLHPVADGYQLEGFLDTADGFVELRPVEGDAPPSAHRLQQLDPSDDADHAPAAHLAAHAEELAEHDGHAGGDHDDQDALVQPRSTAAVGVTTVDVMVVFARGVRSNLRASALVNTANQALINSGTPVRLNLIHELHTSYTQASNAQGGHREDLRRMSANTLLGNGADLRRARWRFRADLVALLVPDMRRDSAVSGNPLTCGVATLGRTNPSRALDGFSVTAINDCGAAAFVHEIGHNLGANHDLPSTGSTGCFPFSYSCGHVVDGVARDVMSYASGCSRGCPRRLQFSSPGVNFLNASSRSGTQVRDNARSITQLRPTVTGLFTRFADVLPSNELSWAVYWLTDTRIASGATATRFNASRPATRAHTVTFLHRLAGAPASPRGRSFSDVPTGAYFSDATRWARAANGITGGCTRTQFCPGATTTRAQFVVMLYRFAGSPAGDDRHGFADVERGTERARAVAWGARHGIVRGVSSTRFDPAGDVTRGHVARFLYRYAERSAAAGSGAVRVGVTRPSALR